LTRVHWNTGLDGDDGGFADFASNLGAVATAAAARGPVTNGNPTW
jgi:hypothetical protein